MAKIRTVAEIQTELTAKQSALNAIFEEAKNDAGELEMSMDQVEDARAKNEELSALGEELERAREIDEIFQKNQQAIRDQQRPAQHLPMPKQNGQAHGGMQYQPQEMPKSLGEMVTESNGYKAWRPGGNFLVDLPKYDPALLQRKTTMTTAAGFAPFVERLDRIIESAQRRPMVADMLPQTTTVQNAIKYMEETTFTNAAAAVAENDGTGLPESALAYTERTQAVEKVGTFLPVTDEQLEDVPQLQSLINNRLTLMLLLTEETQLLSGSGSSPQLEGFYNKTGIQTQAKGADPVPDAIYKAMTLVRHTGFADPTGVILHPNDWQDIRLLRTTDGIYIWGSPSEAGPERIWGLPIVATSAATENTGLVGDFQLYSELFRRLGAAIEVSNSHSDYFVKDLQAIKIRERIALVIYRAAAFCTVTGI